jgi:hypothetical protein
MTVRIAFVAAIALGLAACSQKIAEEDVDFTPPTNLPRADFESGLIKRFHRLDRDGDGIVRIADLKRRPERLKRYDANNDGKLTFDEFKAGSIARFDATDTNHDAILSSDERDAAGWGRDADARRAAHDNETAE